MGIKKTPKQKQAVAHMSDPVIRALLLSGGSRSGKTFIICYALVVRALKAAGSRHLITRFHFRDVKNAVGRDTMPRVLKLIGTPYSLDRTDWFFTLPNGSEIWLGGLDDDERVEKILGMEYSTIYYNEASQISYTHTPRHRRGSRRSATSSTGHTSTATRRQRATGSINSFSSTSTPRPASRSRARSATRSST